MKFKNGDSVIWRVPHDKSEMEKKFYVAKIAQVNLISKKMCIITIENPLHARPVYFVDLEPLVLPNDLFKDLL